MKKFLGKLALATATAVVATTLASPSASAASGAFVICVDANFHSCGVLIVADKQIPVPELRDIHTGSVPSFADNISSLHNQTDSGVCLYTNSNYWGNFLWVAKGVKLAQLASPFQDSLSSIRFGSSPSAC